MTQRMRQPSSDAPLSPPEPDLRAKLRQLAGDAEPGEQGAVFDRSAVEQHGPPSTTALDEGEADAEDTGERLDLLADLELREGETDDPIEAAEEGFTYVPPIDPPIVPGGDENAQVASGLGSSALDEPYDSDHHSAFIESGDEFSARVREALRADSLTSPYADRIRIEARGGVVTLRGVVDDLTDSDGILAVAEYVDGVTEVIDQLRIRGM